MIIGILCWADESPHWLASCIASFAPAWDHLVALDGKYLLFPGSLDEPSSTIEQSEAVVDACVGVGLPFTLYRPTQPYVNNEVEKRNLSLKLANAVKTSEKDWYFVVDADNMARSLGGTRAQLEAAPDDCLAAEYGVYHYWDREEIIDRTGIDPHQSYGEVLPDKTRGIYRALDGLEYAGAHWCLRAPDKKGGWTWIWGNPRCHQPFAEALDLSDSCKVHHRRAYRSPLRVEQARTYYALRDELKVEQVAAVWVEGLNGELLEVT